MIARTATGMDAAPAPRAANRQDRLSEWIVVAVIAAMLLAGALLKVAVEGQTRTADAGGVQLSYPAAWQQSSAADGQAILRVRDTRAAGYPTTMEVRRVAVDASAPATQTLAIVANDLTLSRGRELTAFKVFGVTANETINGLPAAKARYVFVEAAGNALQESLPAVVVGDDYLLRKGNAVYVFTLHATQQNRDEAMPAFERFVSSAQLP